MPPRSIVRWLAPAAFVFALAFPTSVFASAPTADDKTPTTLEDNPVDITLSGGDAGGSPLTFAIASGPTNGTLGSIGTPNCDGLTPSTCTAVVTYTPNANIDGSDSFTYTTNNGVDSLPATVSITVTFVNDVPSFTKGADQTVLKDSGAASVPGWATAISPGSGANESGQTVSFNVSATDTSLFSTQPAIASNGDMTFTPAASKYGTTTVTVSITDNGGIANGGVDTSADQPFAITVPGPPIAHNDTATVAENAAATAINVLANDTYLPNPPESLVISAVGQGGHGTVIITGGGTGLTYKPNSLFSGTDLFVYTISDPRGMTASASVLVTVAKDVTPPFVGLPTESIRTGISIGTTIGIHVAWSGSDAGVGLSRFELQRQVDAGAWTAQALATPLTTSINQFITVGHRYRYRVRDVDRNGNASAYRYTAYLTPGIYQETATQVTYAGAWAKSPLNASNSGGYTKYAYGGGKSATFTATARDFAFVGPISSTRGSARIYVDGVLVATVSEHNTTTIYRRVLWSRHFSTSSTHAIRVVLVGDGRIDVDAFVTLR